MSKRLWKVLFTGSRDWSDYDAVHEALTEESEYASRHNLSLMVIHGGASGLDEITENICEEVGVWTAVVKARWKAHKYKIAGPLRNRAMVNLEPDKVRAFPLPHSKGTIDCMKAAKAADIPVQQHKQREEVGR